MYWKALTTPGGTEGAGLTLTVETEQRPGLVIEYGGGGRTRIQSDAGPALWARAEAYYEGVWLVRRDAPYELAVVPPIKAAEARSIETAEGWMKWFARGLGNSDKSPLRPGVWQLTELRQEKPDSAHQARDEVTDVFLPVDPDGLPAPAYGLRRSVSLPRAHYESWGINGSGGVFPLRSPSDVDAARVKAWRKHAREGTLPPILLWWVGAFDLHLVIDGHDRLLASTAEGTQPRAITLWQPSEDPIEVPARWREELVRNYEAAFKSEDRLSERSREELNRSLVNGLRRWRRSGTTARARPDMGEQWIEEVRAELESEPELADRVCGDL